MKRVTIKMTDADFEEMMDASQDDSQYGLAIYSFSEDGRQRSFWEFDIVDADDDEPTVETINSI